MNQTFWTTYVLTIHVWAKERKCFSEVYGSFQTDLINVSSHLFKGIYNLNGSSIMLLLFWNDVSYTLQNPPLHCFFLSSLPASLIFSIFLFFAITSFLPKNTTKLCVQPTALQTDFITVFLFLILLNPVQPLRARLTSSLR